MATLEGTYVRRLARQEGALTLLENDMAARGVTTARGRVRATYAAYLTTIGTWDKLAMRIGLARKARPTQTIESILEYRQRDAQLAAEAEAARHASVTGAGEVPFVDVPPIRR